MSGRLETIWVKRAYGGVMDPVPSVRVVQGKGLENDANFGAPRQVTLIEREVWDRLMGELNADVDPSGRRANLLLSGCSLKDSRGKILRIGSTRIRIKGETRPCERMDDAVPGLREAMKPHWGGGAYGEVLDSAELNVGDAVAWEDEA